MFVFVRILMLTLLVAMAWTAIIKELEIRELETEVADNAMWLDFTEQKINDLQDIADETQRECIDLLEYSKPADMSDRVDMAGYDCSITSEGDLLQPSGLWLFRDLSCQKLDENYDYQIH